MPRSYWLKKTLKANTLYEMEDDRFFVIKKVGTDITSLVTAKVDGIPVDDFTNVIAPMAKTSSNLLGPLDLKDKYIPVPPQRKLLFESTSSGNIYIEGSLIVLAPGESPDPAYLSRYNTFEKLQLKYVDVTADCGSSIAAGQEIKVAELKPETIEDWLFQRFAGVSVTGLASALTYGQLAIKFYLDGTPLDLLEEAGLPHGIDAMKMPLPPTDSAEKEPFTFEDVPISLPGGHTLKVVARNISGSTLSAATGQTIKVRFVALYDRTVKG